MYCARHPKAETALTCGRCGAPVCNRCTVHADVGIRCPACASTKNVGGGRGIPFRNTFGVVTTVLILGTWAYWLFGFIPLSFGGSGDDYDDFPESVLYAGVITVEQVIDPWEQEEAVPEAGHRFMAFELTVENPPDSEEEILWSATGLKLTDTENFAYAPATLPSDSQLPYLSLRPGEKTSSRVVFEVNQGNAAKSLTYWSTEVDLPR